MDFATLPPEVTSVLMYTGPGSAPIMTAASAWDGLAAELRSIAAAYRSIVSGLTSQAWLGPSSAAMAAAIAPYVAWLTSASAEAEQTATQAKAAAAAYETAYGLTVPPAAVAANRAQWLALVATNVLGQNTAAIAANEAHYGAMWAQDTAAMYGYAGSAAAAVELTPFTPPQQQTTRPTDPAGPAAQAVGNSAGSGAQSVMSHVAQALAAAPVQATPVESLLELPSALLDLVGLDVVSSIGLGMAAASWAAASANGEFLVSLDYRLLCGQREVLHAIDPSYPGCEDIAATEPWVALVGSPQQPPVSAGIGQAITAGRLSVPLSWAVAAPEVRSVAYGLPTTNPAAAPTASAGTAAAAFSQMGLAGMAGSALAGSVNGGRRDSVGATPRTSAKAPEPPPGGLETRVSARLEEFARLHKSGVLTDDEFAEQKRHLLGWWAATLTAPAEPGEKDSGTPAR